MPDLTSRKASHVYTHQPTRPVIMTRRTSPFDAKDWSLNHEGLVLSDVCPFVLLVSFYMNKHRASTFCHKSPPKHLLFNPLYKWKPYRFASTHPPLHQLHGGSKVEATRVSSTTHKQLYFSYLNSKKLQKVEALANSHSFFANPEPCASWNQLAEDE